MAGLVKTVNPHSDPMVSAKWLNAHLDDENVVTLDATWCMPGDDAPYPDLFIDGVSMDIDAVADLSADLPHMLPNPADFETHMRKLGINSDSHIICYDKHGLFSAPRAWWMFRAMGHDNVQVLDGGLPDWLANGFPTVSAVRTATEGNFTATYNPDLVRRIEDVRNGLQSCQILDARPKGRFDGTLPEPRKSLSSGHMPGAHSVPFSNLKSPDGFLKSRDALGDIFGNFDQEKQVIATCGSGITACGIALALARLGVWDAAVYDGSWVEWASTPNSPIVKAE